MPKRDKQQNGHYISQLRLYARSTTLFSPICHEYSRGFSSMFHCIYRINFKWKHFLYKCALHVSMRNVNSSTPFHLFAVDLSQFITIEFFLVREHRAHGVLEIDFVMFFVLQDKKGIPC